MSSLDEGPTSRDLSPVLDTPAVEVFGRYNLIERIGAGGMAEVFRAEHAGAHGFVRTLAVKRLRADLTQAQEISRLFADEARLSARLHHPNIVQIFEFGEVDGRPYLAMEFLDGRNLAEVNRALRRAGERMVPALAVYIAREVARALAYAHALQDERDRPLALVHRDVSPANIMVLRAGAVKLVDFGIARAEDELRMSVTDGRILKGKARYMSPEQIMGNPVDGRSDIFALGVVLWEMLTGQRLFAGSSAFEAMWSVMHAEVPPPSRFAAELPPALDRIVLCALSRTPGRRYRTADKLASDLEEVMRELRVRHGDLSALLGRLFGPAATRPGPVAPTQEASEEDCPPSAVTQSPTLPLSPLPRRRPGAEEPIAPPDAREPGVLSGEETIVASDPVTRQVADAEMKAILSQDTPDEGLSLAGPPTAPHGPWRQVMAKVLEGDEEPTVHDGPEPAPSGPAEATRPAEGPPVIAAEPALSVPPRPRRSLFAGALALAALAVVGLTVASSGRDRRPTTQAATTLAKPVPRTTAVSMTPAPAREIQSPASPGPCGGTPYLRSMERSSASSEAVMSVARRLGPEPAATGPLPLAEAAAPPVESVEEPPAPPEPPIVQRRVRGKRARAMALRSPRTTARTGAAQERGERTFSLDNLNPFVE